MSKVSKIILQSIAVVIILLLAGWITNCTKKEAPKPFGAIPSERQLIWHNMKYHAFIHFGPNTFTDIEWGHGDESPDVFNPTSLECRQWAKVIKDAGMEGAIITAKHHDGFCLWPSEYSTHTVRESRWRDGKGDVLKDLSEACREFGVKFGVYVSPWDRNHPTYFTEEYNEVFKKMLEEVLTNYGEVYYVFFDGAFSVGPDGKRQEYDWEGFIDVVRRCQPNAVIFSDGGPDVRWIGNERGYAAETNWCTVKKGAFYPGIGGVNDQLQTGHEDGELWIPSEVNTSIRPGWFYHKQEDNKVKSLNRLIENWYHSVGLNGNFLLNLPPDTRGLIHENDIKRLAELKKYLEEAFAVDLAEKASAKATNNRGKSFSAKKAIDGDSETYWATDDDIASASLELDFGKPIEVNALLIQEYINLGQRVRSFAIEAFVDDNFTQVATGFTIGNRRIVKFETITTDKLKINIVAKSCPLISNIEVYRVPENIFPGADETTPSRAQFFSWINNTNEGAAEEQTLINLEFFRWLQEEYGMVLDIYAFDAGAIDGKGFYGSIYSERFKHQFPNGFDRVYQKAKQIGTRLGVWGGPDGFGDTLEEEKARIDMMVKLCQDYDFMLFKFDAVSGSLRPENQDAFIKMMVDCRKYSPDLILLNHRLELGKGLPYATTSLWEGAETYIDVFMSNRVTGTHHRVGALSRGLPPDLIRLTEDHGVCLSSCLDYWEDDLILQAFNRCLILAPEIYANPWLLRDDEFPKLARIYNLHRRNRDILVNGMVLPEDNYGPHAVSRGDDSKRFLTLRNLTWEPVRYKIQLDEEIGLKNTKDVELRQFHSTENILGTFHFGETVEVEVPPFRSCLITAASERMKEIGIEGCHYEIVRDTKDKDVIIKLLGMPGEVAEIKVISPGRKFKSARLDGKQANILAEDKSLEIAFNGEPYQKMWHRKLGDLETCEVPENARAFYEATCFAADNNALEVRSLMRSGSTEIPQVQKARDAFFNQEVLIERGVWDKFLFDKDLDTSFYVNTRFGRDLRINGGALRIDFGELIEIDRLVIHVKDEQSLQPYKRDEIVRTEVSADLREWERIFMLAGKTMEMDLSDAGPIRFVRLAGSPTQVFEIEGFRDGQRLDSRKWRASNLFSPYGRFRAHYAWSFSFVLDEIPAGGYLAIPINGVHGKEGAYAAAKIDGQLVGAPDRAVSFPSNTWEYYVREYDRNYTYYIPLDKSMIGKPIEVYVLGMNKDAKELKPEVWLTAYPIPYIEKELILIN